MSTKEINLSVIIPTYNCSKTLRGALESVRWAKEIVVVDMGSVDGTLDIAKQFKAKIITNVPNDGNFDKNRKLGMEVATSEWLLKLDSDEYLSPELQKEIKKILLQENKCNGYKIRNKLFMFGFEIKHGFVKPNSSEMRLVRNGCWKYNPYKYHQNIEVEGKTSILKNFYYHYNYSNVKQFINKTNLYTSEDCKHYLRKISLFDVIQAPFRSFLKLFLLQQGFLDGKVGFEVSYLFGIYNLIEKIKRYEFQFIK